ncbi:hypothetical protein MPC1_6840004 [Methylocella tundrae]|nr:hypothetical protein MPC1_6840004 [Methylocella tundrae]
MSNAESAQKFGAPALQESQIGGVINNAGKIGIFIIDAQVKAVRLVRRAGRLFRFVSHEPRTMGFLTTKKLSFFASDRSSLAGVAEPADMVGILAHEQSVADGETS